MSELGHLLTDGPHWAFEVIASIAETIVLGVAAVCLPKVVNPAKRWLARHDRDKHHA